MHDKVLTAGFGTGQPTRNRPPSALSPCGTPAPAAETRGRTALTGVKPGIICEHQDNNRWIRPGVNGIGPVFGIMTSRFATLRKRRRGANLQRRSDMKSLKGIRVTNSLEYSDLPHPVDYRQSAGEHGVAGIRHRRPGSSVRNCWSGRWSSASAARSSASIFRNRWREPCWIARRSRSPAQAEQGHLRLRPRDCGPPSDHHAGSLGVYSPDPNAFATGPSKNNAMVAVSTGLLANLREDEVKAVLAHENGPRLQRRHVLDYGPRRVDEHLCVLHQQFRVPNDRANRRVTARKAKQAARPGFRGLYLLQVVLSILAMLVVSYGIRAPGICGRCVLPRRCMGKTR